MKTHKYKTLKGLIRNCRQFSLYTLLSGRYCHIKTGWGNLKLSEELQKEVYTLFSNLIGDFDLNMSTCGILERVIINQNFNCSYIAGQDYIGELRYIRKLIKRGY